MAMRTRHGRVQQHPALRTVLHARARAFTLLPTSRCARWVCTLAHDEHAVHSSGHRLGRAHRRLGIRAHERELPLLDSDPLHPREGLAQRADGRVLGPMRIVTRARSVVTSRSSGGTLAGS